MTQQSVHNGWSCLPIAFATILNISLNRLLTLVGHDGSEILWPDLSEPYCRRSFHIQEMILVCNSLGYSVTPFEPHPVSNTLSNTKTLDHSEKVDKIIQSSKGVLVGLTRHNLPHAVAWDNNKCIDNNIVDFNGFQVREFWKIHP